MMTVLMTGATAFLTTIILMLLRRRLAPQAGVIDLPGGRKTHRGEIPVIGGIAMYLGEIVLGPIDFMFTVLATVALINAFNMLDGVDGIAGGVALVALAGPALVLWMLPVPIVELFTSTIRRKAADRIRAPVPAAQLLADPSQAEAGSRRQRCAAPVQVT